MNRLAFGEFHQKHFGSQQKAYWNSILFQQQRQQQQQQHQQQQYYQYNTDYSNFNTQPNQHYDYTQNEQQQEYLNYQNYYYQQYYTDQQYADPNQEYIEEEEEAEEYGELSKEAIEIFKFSEAYRKEKELERQRAEEEEQEGMENWEYDESNVHCSGGIEAPVTSLVLLKPEAERPEKNSKLRIQEDLLNSAYLASCKNTDDSSPVVLWPVLPFNM